MLRNVILGAAVFSIVCIPIARADDAKNAQTPAADAKGKQANDPGANQSITLEKFLNKLHAGNQKEIELGKLAQEKGQSQEVKDYGKTLVQDHQNADKQVMDLAKAQNIQLMDPKQWEAQHKKDAEANKDQNTRSDHADKHEDAQAKLSGLSGAEFDKEFVTCMVKDHSKTLDLLDKARTDSQLAPAKDLAEKLRGPIQKHTQNAERMASNMGIQIPGTTKSARANTDQDADSQRNANPNASQNQNSTNSPSQQAK